MNPTAQSMISRFLVLQSHLLAVFLQAGQIAADGVRDIRQRLLSRRALGDATGQRGALGDEDAVLVRLDNDAEFHESVGLAVSFEQRNGGLQTLNGFPAGSALPIRLGKLRAEGDEPLALTVNLRGDFQLHGKRLTLFGSRHNGGENAIHVGAVAGDKFPVERRG